MAIAHGDDDDEPLPVLDDVAEATDVIASVEPEVEEMPEITLDNAIQERIEDNLIDEPGEISAPAKEAAGAASNKKAGMQVSLPPKKAKKADAELERIASELAKAKTIDDVDDKMAETLFGEELNFVASQVVASGASGEPANDAALFDTAAAQLAQAAGSPVVEGAPVEPQEPELEVALETRDTSGEAGIDLSASQRLKTVRALNTDLHPSLREPGNGDDPGPDVPARDLPTPEPIEDQINTSMTQTLKALDVRPPLSRDADDDDADDDENKGGFFSRFRRS